MHRVRILHHRSGRVSIPALLVAILLSLLLASCGDDGEEGGASGGSTAEDRAAENDAGGDRAEGVERAPESADDRHPDPPDAGIGDRPGADVHEEPQPSTREPHAGERREIERAVRRYLHALRQRDGERLCEETFVDGALEQVRLPATGEGCADRVSASIGRPGEPGGPRWLGARLAGSRTVIVVEGGDGRLTGTIANRLSGTDRTWIEDDVIYLREIDQRWRIVKPSAVFYRAVGYIEIPIRALTPP